VGPQLVRGGALAARQEKTKTELVIPSHPVLRSELGQAPGGHLAFLMTAEGMPFVSGTAFYNWFVDCCAAAALLPGRSPHGLGEACARRLAEAGCSTHRIMAIMGHKSLVEVERYTRDANQPRLAAAAVAKMGRAPKSET